MNINGLENIGNHGIPPLSLRDLIKESQVETIDFDIDDYDAGFDLILVNRKRIKIRVSTMPSADTAFYIQQ